MTSVPERDWKVFKKVHPLALDRFCARCLAEARKALQQSAKSSHEVYLELYKLMQDRDKDVARIFDDYRRSTALFQIAMMEREALLTREEWQEFSDETRESIVRSRAAFGGDPGADRFFEPPRTD